MTEEWPSIWLSTICFAPMYLQKGQWKSSLLVHLEMGVSPSRSILMCLYISEGKRIDIKGAAIRNPQDKIYKKKFHLNNKCCSCHVMLTCTISTRKSGWYANMTARVGLGQKVSRACFGPDQPNIIDQIFFIY